jgi:hypothetical protein
MIELRNSLTNALDFSGVTPEIIQALDEPRQLALLALMEASRANDAAVERKNLAVKCVFDAIADEEVKRQIHEDASSPIPFSVAKLEEALGRPLSAGELAAAREQHAIRVRGLLEQRAHAAAVAAYVPSR